MRGKGVILVALMLFAVFASGCIGGTSTKTQAPSEVKLTGDFNKDVIEIGKILEKNGISEVKFAAWGSGDPNSVMRVYGIVDAPIK